MPTPTPLAEKPRTRPDLAHVVRWALLLLGAAFVVAGLVLDEQLQVYWKAATVCLECIGIG